MAESTVKTCKDTIGQRVVGLDLDKEKWKDLLPQVLHQYNRQVNSAMGMTPKEAPHVENREKVSSNLRKQARFNRVCEPIEIGDTVKTFIKKANFSKGTELRFSEALFKVTGVEKNATGDEEYTLNGKSKAYLRRD